MRFHSRSLRAIGLTAAAVLVGQACQEPTAPAGRPGELTVNVYIDRDGSGTRTPADTGLRSQLVSITATTGPTSAYSAVTNDAGEALFTNVSPGIYRLNLPSTPAGAVLTSAPSQSVRVDAIGQATPAEARYAWIPSSISGRIFRDDNSDGDFDAGEGTGAGLYALLSIGTTRVDSVVADAAGLYAFTALQPASYTVDFQQPSTITYTAGASRAVALAAGTNQTLNAVFTGSLIRTIAEARAATSGVFAVRGQLTVAPGRFTSGAGGVNSEVWVQDATGGIAAFSVLTADSLTLSLGDSVEVTGPRSTFSGQAQLSTVTRFVRLNSGAPVLPLVQTLAQARARTEEGKLIRVNNVEVTTVGGGTGAAFNVTVRNTLGDTLVIRVASALTGLTRASFVVGERYNAVGILTQFNGTAQLKIRQATDLTAAAVLPPVNLIRDIRTTGVNGTVYQVRGVVTAAPGMMSSGANSEIWVQDATGGIALFSVPTVDSLTLAVGDTIEVSGTRGAFNGQLQLGTLTGFTRRASGPAPTPLVQSVLQARARTEEGKLMRVNNLRVRSVGGGTGASFSVTTTSAANDTLVIRVGSNLKGISRASFLVDSLYDFVGVLSQFNTAAQLKVRTSADIIPVASGFTITDIGDVRATGVNATAYTVQGVLTLAPGSVTTGTGGVNSELWVQDATGGIAAFSVPTADSTTLFIGDLVRVTGNRAAFSQQLQLGSAVVTRLGAVTPVAAVLQTGPEIATAAQEGRLVRVDNWVVTTVGTGSFAFTVTGTNNGQSVQLRVGSQIKGITPASFTVGQSYSIVGVLSRFNATMQIKPRSIDDITVTP